MEDRARILEQQPALTGTAVVSRSVQRARRWFDKDVQRLTAVLFDGIKMRNIARPLSIWPIFACIFGFSLTIAHAQSRQTVPASNVRPQIMVLGVFHFVPSATDLKRGQPDDILGARRQAEIEELLRRLEKFQPTKIAFEVPYGTLPGDPRRNHPEIIDAQREAYYNEHAVAQVRRQYQDYLAGHFTLTSREMHQIGFRLAQRLHLREVYPLDYKLSMPYDEMTSFARIHGQTAVLDSVNSQLDSLTAEEERLQREGTLLQLVDYLNSGSFQSRLHGTYLEECSVAANGKYEGADVAASWYRRNLVIYSKLRSLVEPNADRILLIYGAGHVKLLREFIEQSSDLEFVDPSPFLGK